MSSTAQRPINALAGPSSNGSSPKDEYDPFSSESGLIPGRRSNYTIKRLGHLHRSARIWDTSDPALAALRDVAGAGDDDHSMSATTAASSASSSAGSSAPISSSSTRREPSTPASSAHDVYTAPIRSQVGMIAPQDTEEGESSAMTPHQRRQGMIFGPAQMAELDDLLVRDQAADGPLQKDVDGDDPGVDDYTVFLVKVDTSSIPPLPDQDSSWGSRLFGCMER